MPFFVRDSAEIHYDRRGSGFPVLLIAPGGMRSATALWDNAPWDPRLLADTYDVIGMDQRNAGRSTAPVTIGDGWATYTADQLALLDHLEIDVCHVIGMCIGGPYIAGLLQAAPQRFASAIMLQPVGIEPDGSNRAAFEEMFDTWADQHRQTRPEVADSAWAALRHSMWDGEFLLTASEDDLPGIDTPVLVALGSDLYHPEYASRRVAELVPGATLVESWKQGPATLDFDRIARRFLERHTP